MVPQPDSVISTPGQESPQTSQGSAPAAPTARATSWQVLTARNFLFLWLGQLISSIGDRFTMVALISFVFATDKVGQYTAQFSFAGMLPGLIFAPFYGWIIDSFERKKVMIAADLIRVVIVLTFIYALSGNNPDYTLGCAALFALGTFNGLFIPARQAALPQIVEPERLLTANGLVALIGPIGTILGSPLAMVVIGVVGPWNAYIVNALCFIASAICIQAISKELWPDTQKQVKEHQPLNKSWREMTDGWRTLRSHPPLLPLVFINGLFAFASLMFLVLVMDYATKQLDYSTLQSMLAPIVDAMRYEPLTPKILQMIAVGLLFVCLGVGMFIGTWIYGAIGKLGQWCGLPFAGLIVLGTGMIALGQLTQLFVILPFAFLLGIAATSVPIPIDARIQNDVDNHHRGRLFALRNMWTTLCGLLALATHIDGSLLKYVGAAALFTWLGTGLIAVSAACFVLLPYLLRTFWTVRHPSGPA
ncbi:hypothetical protein DB346_20425 [Verrucomicrobia bacterium LW23]|nr:hypothetical protein DB346_20425 [Verrucomicrobia bacterium LW23]